MGKIVFAFRLYLAAAMAFAATPAAAQTQIFSASFVANSAGNVGLSYRQAIPNISTGGGAVSVGFNATPSGAFSAAHASVCVQASNFSCAAAPVELTFSGASGFNIPVGGVSIDSDFVGLATSPGQTLLVILDVTSANMPRNGTGTIGWDSYPNTAITWNAASPAGSFVSFSSIYGFSRVRVDTQPPPPPVFGPTATGISGGGRLTLAHGMARLYQDVSAAFVDYAPDTDTTAPMIDATGAAFRQSFVSGANDAAGLSLSLDASWVANSVHDVYLALDGPAPVICSLQWSAGAPSSPDALYRAVKVNGAPIADCRTGPSVAIACPVYQCTLLGTFKVSPVAGIVRCDLSAGKNRECGLWNKDNQVEGILKITDPAPIYDVATTAPHPPDYGQVQPVIGNAAFNGTVIIGRLGNNRVDVDLALNHRGLRLNGEQNSAYTAGIGWNSTTHFCGNSVFANDWSRDSLGINATMNQEYFAGFAGLQVVIAQTLNAWCRPLPFQGIGTAYALERQVWYSGEEWIGSGDFMMTMRFRY